MPKITWEKFLEVSCLTEPTWDCLWCTEGEWRAHAIQAATYQAGLDQDLLAEKLRKELYRDKEVCVESEWLIVRSDGEVRPLCQIDRRCNPWLRESESENTKLIRVRLAGIKCCGRDNFLKVVSQFFPDATDEWRKTSCQQTPSDPSM